MVEKHSCPENFLQIRTEMLSQHPASRTPAADGLKTAALARAAIAGGQVRQRIARRPLRPPGHP